MTEQLRYDKETRRGVWERAATETGHAAARAMLDSFASVGATGFDVTWTTAPDRRNRFAASVSLAELAAPAHMLDAAAARQRNVIVRPHGDGVTFIQLDDLKPTCPPASPPPCF